MANLTQVAPGGVERPDVALKEDLTAVVETANLAKQQAQETADFLETRVPVGRTINSLPLDQDIIITAEDLDVYDKGTIDAKLKGIEAGGYTPVKVNGHLLDRDIILSAGDVGAYSAAEVDGKVSSLVPDSRKINGKPLTSDVIIDASTLDIYTKTEVDSKISNFVTQDRKINGKTLSQDVEISLSDLGGVDQLVPRTFKINNKDMTGVSLDLTADDLGAISESYVDDKLSGYLSVDNQNGLATTPFAITDESFAASVNGSGFYSYAAGTKLDDDGNTVPTSVSDRPEGSESGRVIILTNTATYDEDGNVVTPSSQDLLAFPNDLIGVWFKKSGQTIWTKVTDVSDLTHFLALDNDGELSRNLKVKNGFVFQSEKTDGTTVALSKVTDDKVAVGDASVPLVLQSTVDPVVNIGGSDYKLYSEHNPPPLPDVGAGGGLLAVQTFTESGIYTPTPGTKKIIVELIAGGGSGASPVDASTSYQVGLGGLSGNYVKAILTSNIKEMTVTVGSGGRAIDNSGEHGGTTSIGNVGEETSQFVSAYGGLNGSMLVLASLPISGEYPRLGSTVAQAYGFEILSYKDGSDGGLLPIMTESHLAGGKGGDTHLGTGGMGRRLAAASDPVGFGSGGGGGCAKANESGTKGSNGASGAVSIYEYS